MFFNHSNQSSEFPTHSRNICTLLFWLHIFWTPNWLFLISTTKQTSFSSSFIQVCIFIGETLLFLNWAITADILMVSAENLCLSSGSLEIPATQIVIPKRSHAAWFAKCWYLAAAWVWLITAVFNNPDL